MRRILTKNINTKSYWNRLLKSGTWGKERSWLYVQLAHFLPKKQKIKILDIGCAAGHGIIQLSKELPAATVEACDFSKEGIKHAKLNYGGKITFFVHDVYTDVLKKKYDFILFIETLEHIDNPKKIIKKYMVNCKQMIVTAPYKEKGWKEHVYYFDENSFKDLVSFKKYRILKNPETNRKIIVYLFEK